MTDQRPSIRFAQNFIRSRDLIALLLTKTSINESDVVYEIGGGEGKITEELACVAGRVISFEIDPALYVALVRKFQNTNKVTIRNENFVENGIHDTTYKVFANIPFNQSSDIVHKLLDAYRPPQDCYLFVQEEFAKKLLAHTQLAAVYAPLFDIHIIHHFSATDFYPIPKVRVVLLAFHKREKPLVEKQVYALYRDVVVYLFNQRNKTLTKSLKKLSVSIHLDSAPSAIAPTEWVRLFDHMMKHPNQNWRRVVYGAYDKQVMQQKNIHKIHRTRLSSNWKTS
jgi:16S rRNA A1518/A1519 N6-dimethyltransferase RsmA/KsgA/DIM1 with predicted DNA glycosylase/AP lyase activity